MRDKGERGAEADREVGLGETVAVGVCGCSASQGSAVGEGHVCGVPALVKTWHPAFCGPDEDEGEDASFLG